MANTYPALLDLPSKHLISYQDISPQALLVYAFAALFLLHQILQQYNITALSIPDAVWNSVVAVTPTHLLLDRTQVKELGSSVTWSQKHAAKAESMRNMLGLDSRGLMQQLPAPTNLLKRMSIGCTTSANTISSNAPPGLGNWDNSCYQNSVLQGLTSLSSLRSYLEKWNTEAGEHSTISALREISEKLRSPFNNGKHMWTPAKLKSMSSWQQQDAQEYFSKIMDELDKDVVKLRKTARTQEGCESIVKETHHKTGALEGTVNPLEGMLAQQVICTSCGFTEGLSMIPFNCLTLPLENKPETTLEDCLSEYTKLEPITGVECAKCTLLKTQKELCRLAPAYNRSEQAAKDNAQLKAVLQLPPELRAQVVQRLAAVETALDSDDFTDETLSQACQITKNVRVASTKTRQALLARMPTNLVMHINRSVFDETTGMLRKNYAAVRYPAVLDLGPWILGSSKESEQATTDRSPVAQIGLPRESMWKYIYQIRAIVTHYGRHENGHYIAYRQAPVFTDEDMEQADVDLNAQNQRKQQWWQLSDETVSPMSEAEVLDQGGVFMLFYERVVDSQPGKPIATDAVQQASVQTAKDVTASQSAEMSEQVEDVAWPAILHESDTKANIAPLHAQDIAPSEASLTEDESEADIEEQPPQVVRVPSPSSPLLMRTANAALSTDEHWNVGRFVAAS